MTQAAEAVADTAPAPPPSDEDSRAAALSLLKEASDAPQNDDAPGEKSEAKEPEKKAEDEKEKSPPWKAYERKKKVVQERERAVAEKEQRLSAKEHELSGATERAVRALVEELQEDPYGFFQKHGLDHGKALSELTSKVLKEDTPQAELEKLKAKVDAFEKEKRAQEERAVRQAVEKDFLACVSDEHEGVKDFVDEYGEEDLLAGADRLHDELMADGTFRDLGIARPEKYRDRFKFIVEELERRLRPTLERRRQKYGSGLSRNPSPAQESGPSKSAKPEGGPPGTITSQFAESTGRSREEPLSDEELRELARKQLAGLYRG